MCVKEQKKKGLLTLFCHVMRGISKVSLNRTTLYPATLEIKIEFYLDNIINCMLCVGGIIFNMKLNYSNLFCWKYSHFIMVGFSHRRTSPSLKSENVRSGGSFPDQK
jgi:hypothetical protein